MNRRSFFKVLGVAAGAAVAPQVVLSAAKAPIPESAIALGDLEERVRYSLEWQAWELAHVYRSSDGKDAWYVVRLVVQDPHGEGADLLEYFRNDSRERIASALSRR